MNLIVKCYQNYSIWL